MMFTRNDDKLWIFGEQFSDHSTSHIQGYELGTTNRWVVAMEIHQKQWFCKLSLKLLRQFPNKITVTTFKYTDFFMNELVF